MRRIALATALLAVATTAAPSHAAYVRACVAVGTVRFVPPLTTTIQSGDMYWEYNNTCALVDTGGASGLEGGPGLIDYKYRGSCITADVDDVRVGNESTGTLIGGTLMVRSASNRTAVRLWLILLPTTSPCSMSSALAVNAGPDVG